MLRQAVDEGRAPTFEGLLERGVLIPDCVSSFPSVTPVACAEMVTGAAADRHWISGMNWYHRLERRYVEYGSSLDATRTVGVFRALYDLVYNMNLAHLNPDVETLFEQLDDAGARTAATPFLIYRGRHRHEVSLDGLMRRAVDATRLKFHHHTWGPAELFYGDLYSSRDVPCKSTSIPGPATATPPAARRSWLAPMPSTSSSSRCPTTTTTPTGTAPRQASSRSPRPTIASPNSSRRRRRPRRVPRGARGHRRRGPRPDPGRARAAPGAAARPGVVGAAPSEDRPEPAQLAVSPTGRAAHVYLLPGEGPRAQHADVRRRLSEIEGVDLVCWLEKRGAPLDRGEMGVEDVGEVEAVVERAGQTRSLRPRPGGG